MAVAIHIQGTGGPDVLELRQFERAIPGCGEVWLEHEAIGVNYLDVNHRNGTVPINLPSGLGVEGAGLVTAVGPGVNNVRVGDRVVYALGPLGSYSSGRLIPASQLVTLPAAIDCDVAASLFLKGLTAQYLLKSTYKVGPGTTVLLYGVGGALGQIMAAWASHLGAYVIGLVSRPESVDVAAAAGCADVLVWNRVTLPGEVARLTRDRMADVVYDGIGRDTFSTSLASLRARGMMVSIGAISGLPAPIDIRTINAGSYFLTRPGLAAHIADSGEYAERSHDLFNAIEGGIITPKIWKCFPLERAAEVHRLIESGKSAGPVLLKP